LIQPQNLKNAKLGQDIAKDTQRLHQYKEASKQMESLTNGLAALTAQLNKTEEDVAEGDLYAWTVDSIRRFKTAYHVDIPTIGQPSQSECDLFAAFPYRQFRFVLTGTAYYHDLGKFIADFENKFPHCRILNLTMDVGGGGVNGEKLNFRMDVAVLIKPAN
jgi:hypothetical protein